MRANILSQVVYPLLLLLCAFSTAQAVTISVQYAPGTLFYSGIDGTAKATINAAAADVSAAITSSLNAISTDVFAATNGATTVTFDWSYSYTDPSTGDLTTRESASIAGDAVTIFAGTRSLFGNTLGVGGASGIELSLRVSGSPGQSPPAVVSAATQSEAALTRGGGPVIGTVAGEFDFLGTVTNYAVDYGIAYGSLSLDNDANDNGVADAPAALDNYWHWDYSTPVAAGKNDLYSVALHEILHAVGIGSSGSWNDLTSGTTWNGTEVQSIAGSGTNLIAASGSHIASSVMSTRISDGMPQEVVMDPTITSGTRKEITALDLAFLRDIGYETMTPTLPNPPDYDGDGDIDGADLATLVSGYGMNANGDADSDGDTDGADFLVWQRQYTGPLTTLNAINVPEPSALWLLLAGIVLSKACRRT